MFDTLRSELSWRWHKSDRLLEHMGNPEYRPQKCLSCGELFMAHGRGNPDDISYFDDFCEDCLHEMHEGDPSEPKWKERLYIALELMRKGPLQEWKRFWNRWAYVAPLLKAVLCLIVDHQLDYREYKGDLLDDVGTVGIPNSDGWWIIEAHPKMWGYNLDNDWPELGW